MMLGPNFAAELLCRLTPGFGLRRRSQDGDGSSQKKSAQEAIQPRSHRRNLPQRNGREQS